MSSKRSVGAGLANLVSDWGGFERLVADLNETGDVTVERDVIVKGRSGAPRQIDVLIRHKKGFHEYITIVECKYWRENVKRLHVDALATTLRELGAAKGVIVSAKGFQSGAIKQAQHESIDLFKIREPTDEEWGRPGRKIEFFFQFYSISIGNLVPQQALWLGPGAPPLVCNLNLHLSQDKNRSSTPIFDTKITEKTLEDILERVGQEQAINISHQFPRGLLNGADGEGLVKKKMTVRFLRGLKIGAYGGLIEVPALEFDLGVKTSFSAFRFDRASSYVFALAIEDCIRRSVVTASRRAADEITEIFDLSGNKPDVKEDVLQNGSILHIGLKGLEAFEQFVSLQDGEWQITTTNGNK